MNYPLISEYVEAIKAAEDNFEQLRHLRPVLGEDGEPVMTSGNFAVVFKMKDEQTGKLHAVKCFLKEQEGRAEAYRQIAEELEYVSSTFLTPIKYLDKELFVDSANSEDSEFPVLLMDWVEGQTLDKYIREHIDDQYELSLLAYQFSRLAMWLMPQPFAHGDLKPDNILVKEDGTLVLVDYDGMYVPAMKGQKARELGSPDFRHPSRTETDFDEHIDDFSLVLLLLSLKIIRMDKTFLDKYGSKDNCSVFVDADLRDIANSAANQKLLSLITKDGLCQIYTLFIMALAEKEIKKDVFEVILKSIISETKNEFLWRKAQKICEEGKASEEQLRKAYQIFLQLSNEQHIEARICLSCCLRNGYGCNKDENEGVQLLRSCCETNNGRAQLSLGFCYEKGLGVPQNYEQAVEWYRKAVEQGGHKAQFALGLCYEYGKGVPQNYEQAVKWYRKAAEQGNVSAQCNLGRCYKYGRGITQSYEMAVEWYRKAAEQEDETAQYVLGLCYEKGHGVPQNYEMAEEWFSKAAENGNKDAKQKLEIMTNIKCTKVSEEDLANAWTDEFGVKYSADKTHLIKAPRDIIKYSIREGTKYINDRAFYFCVKLVSITIPESVMYVGDSAFGECHNLSEVKNSGKIETVGHFSFAGCRSLKSIKFNEGLVKMGGSVFKGCASLHSVYIPSSVDSFGDLFPSNGIWLHANRVTTFDYCDSLKGIIIPVGSRSKFEKLLPNYKDKLVDENRGWRIKETRPFSPGEIAAVARAEVVPSQYGNSVCFFMNGGGQTYIPLLNTSSLTVGDSVDLKTAKLVTLCREGKDDIYRVIE